MRAELVAGASLLMATALPAHEPEPSRFSYHRDVAPILARHCTGCHREGGLGPMSLEAYRAVLPWGRAIRREVLERRMPPWQPEEGLIGLRGARLLSAAEIDVLADWVSGAMPEGDVVRVAAVRAAPPPAAAILPDLVLASPAAVTIGADDPTSSACVVLEPILTEARWLRRLEFRPGNPRATRRALVWLADDCDASVAPLHVWVPGQAGRRPRPQLGERVGAGARLALRIEYVKRWEDDGIELLDASSLALWFGGDADDALRRIALRGTLKLPEDWELLGWMGTGAEAGPLTLIAQLPSGASRLLFEVRDPDPIWLGRYEPTDPLRLPAGTLLDVSGGEIVIEVAEY